ncbi:MAG TPA: hypothetical protein VKD69_02665 [Vicinamibacterales bacterium]|nr:hypothetical protein [Vicinamibacterales bacterium]
MSGMLRSLRTALLASLTAAAFVVTPHSQSILGSPSEANHFIATPKGWVHPKTPWGEPDIQANLNMMQAAGVPLERCANAIRFGGPPCDMNKAFWTDEEFKQRVAAASGRGDPGRQLIEKGEYGRALLSGVTDPSTPQRQTGLIVDPPNGLLPPLTAEGKRRALEMRSGWSLPGESPAFDWTTDFDSWDRCITRGMPSSMMPYRYNGGFRIWQAPGVVVFDLEMIHDTRIVFTDGRPPLPSAHKQYMGDSRGRWDGNTLVVETTNYKGGLAPMINLAVVGSPAGNRFPHSDQMKTTERITRLNDEMWLYEIKTEDPVILTGPFTVRYPMRHDPKYEWWEYACHEGNVIVPNYVTTSRFERANPQPEKAVPVQAEADVANALAGTWVGRPRIATIDYDIELQFTKTPDGGVIGTLIGTTLPKEEKIDRPLRKLTLKDRRLNWEFPNTQPWNYAGELSADGTRITGTTNSIQGGAQLEFRKR